MKPLLFLSTLLLSISSAFGQCSVAVNDSLYQNFDYVLNATDVVGQAPFQFNWTVTDGNGVPLQFIQNNTGDSITIPAQTIQSAYGCVIYQLCMTDALMCTTCTAADTSGLQVPFNCFSAFSSSMVGPNQIAITMNNDIPPFLIVQQFMQWTDGDGQSQGMPYMGPGTVITYTPGPQNTNDMFYLCTMSILTTGGCLSCDSIPYSMANLSENTMNFSMSPNPANDQLVLSGSDKIDHVTISNLNGQIISTFEIDQMNDAIIPTHDLPNGFYLVEVQSIHGTAVRRLSIQH
jgi:hypothetical protein